jgi:hypothetical protein
MVMGRGEGPGTSGPARRWQCQWVDSVGPLGKGASAGSRPTRRVRQRRGGGGDPDPESRRVPVTRILHASGWGPGSGPAGHRGRRVEAGGGGQRVQVSFKIKLGERESTLS